MLKFNKNRDHIDVKFYVDNFSVVIGFIGFSPEPQFFIEEQGFGLSPEHMKTIFEYMETLP